MLAASSRMWLAGNPGPPPSPATITLIFVVVALGMAVAVVAAVPRRHREAPLREEMGTRQAVIFQAPVRVMDGGVGLPVAQRGSFRLVVRGDLIEVSSSFRPAPLSRPPDPAPFSRPPDPAPLSRPPDRHRSAGVGAVGRRPRNRYL